MSCSARRAFVLAFQFGATSERTRSPQIPQVVTISVVMGGELCVLVPAIASPGRRETVQTCCDFSRPYNLPMLHRPEPSSWAAPLPDLSQPAISQRIRIGSHVFRLAISDVQRDVPREPDTHLVQIGVFYGDQP